MMKRLGRAERTLRDINLDNSDDSSVAVTSRRRTVDAVMSDDEDVAHRRQLHRRHIHTHPVCVAYNVCLPRSLNFTAASPLSELETTIKPATGGRPSVLMYCEIHRSRRGSLQKTSQVHI